jgi:predicted Zn-ribbon and HTH transcriptional regulator
MNNRRVRKFNRFENNIIKYRDEARIFCLCGYEIQSIKKIKHCPKCKARLK